MARMSYRKRKKQRRLKQYRNEYATGLESKGVSRHTGAKAGKLDQRPAPTPRPPETEELFDGRAAARDTAKSIRKEWPIEDHFRGPLIRNMVKIVKKSPRDKTKISAFNAIVSADRVNVTREKMALDEKRSPAKSLHLHGLIDARSVEDILDLSDEERADRTMAIFDRARARRDGLVAGNDDSPG